MLTTHDLYPNVLVIFKWLVSNTPYLIHEGSIAPHITSSGVLLVVECLQKRNQVAYDNKLVYNTSGAAHLTGIIPPCET